MQRRHGVSAPFRPERVDGLAESSSARDARAPACKTQVARTSLDALLLESAHISPVVSRPDGRLGQCRKAALRGKSGLHGHAVPDNVRREEAARKRGEPQGKCHREGDRPTPARVTARVKRCGKSAPRFRQRKRHGKPHREQDRIGTARTAQASRDLCPDPAVRVGCWRRRATGVPEEWPSRGRFACRPTEPGLQAG